MDDPELKSLESAEPSDAAGADETAAFSPFRELRVLATQTVAVTPTLHHLELYTLHGLLTLLWHGDRDADAVVVMAGGAMGGLLGPADGLFHDLGEQLAGEGIGCIRVSYRQPNDLVACTHDLVAVADLAGRTGARQFITMGHSFGGAIALRAALLLGRHCAGVVTLATQSAGCERVDALADDVPVLLFHGERDELLVPAVSEMVTMLIGHGELVLLPGTGHLLVEAGTELRSRLRQWIPASFAAHEARADS